MILARKVDVLNMKQNSKPATYGSAGSGLRVPDFTTTWWASRGDEGRKFMWYVAVIILAYIAARIAPEGKELIFRGVVALLGVHLIWTLMSSGKINVLSWTVVLGMLTYFVLAWGYPKDVPRIFDASWGLSKKVVHSAANKVESANTDYDNPPQADQASPATTPQAQSQSVPLKRIHLNSEWSAPVYPLPLGGRIGFTCTEPDVEMMVDFTSATNSLVSPGQAFSCWTPVHIGDGLVNPKYFFRSKSGGDVIVQNGV